MRIINRRRLAALATTGVTLAATLGAAVVAAPAASAHGSYRHCTTSASLFAADNPDYSVAIPLGYDESHVTATCYLTDGDTGTGVRVLQRALNKCYSAGLTVDGVFGDLTEAALRCAGRRGRPERPSTVSTAPTRGTTSDGRPTAGARGSSCTATSGPTSSG
ncbi:peptidoglycan-binding protein [Streptomyces sp. NPDC051740]|uniref:peptidoglycan-binding protein n=1 Tax=Streptomyces sp. NPDC051740 TaxID=3365673 RepID=UPI00379CB004